MLRFSHTPQVPVPPWAQLTNYKSELLSRCYILMRLLCVNHIKNKQVLLNYIDDFVPHITFDVECVQAAVG